MPVRCGFNFSAGIVVAMIYYVVFTWAIRTLDLRTPGREDDDAMTPPAQDEPHKDAKKDYTHMAAVILEGLPEELVRVSGGSSSAIEDSNRT